LKTKKTQTRLLKDLTKPLVRNIMLKQIMNFETTGAFLAGLGIGSFLVWLAYILIG
jgi:hypothetical protein